MDRLIPVVVIKSIEETEKILSALIKNEINCAEITLRSNCAIDAIKLASKLFPNMNIGAGTIINLEQCKNAINAGAKFIVSPGLNKEIAVFCKTKNIPYYPGCVTPTEIMSALELGINIVKFFPANVYGGIDGIKALSGPFPQVKFIPTGGISRANIDDYLNCDKVAAVGGSFFVKEALEKWEK